MKIFLFFFLEGNKIAWSAHKNRVGLVRGNANIVFRPYKSQMHAVSELTSHSCLKL